MSDTYKEPVIIKHNNIIGKIYSPVLTEDEYNKRMEAIKKAAIRLVLSK
jgi:hypothetical protein